MRDELRKPDDLKPAGSDPWELEAALLALEPQPARANRDVVLYEAGRAAALKCAGSLRGEFRRRWLWPVTSLVSISAAVVFAVLFWAGTDSGRAGRGEEVSPERVRIVYVQPPSAKREAVRAPHPRRQADREVHPARAVAVAQTPSIVDPQEMEARLVRSRFPILTTDVDRLPASPPTAPFSPRPPQTYRQLRDSLTGKDRPGPSSAVSGGLLSLPWKL